MLSKRPLDTNVESNQVDKKPRIDKVDYKTGFDNPQLSDCTLIIISKTQGPRVSGANPPTSPQSQRVESPVTLHKGRVAGTTEETWKEGESGKDEVRGREGKGKIVSDGLETPEEEIAEGESNCNQRTEERAECILDLDPLEHSSPVLEVEQEETYRRLHVSRLLLALHSTYFHQQFAKEHQVEVTITVQNPCQIRHFLDVIRCIYDVEMVSPIHELFEVFSLAVSYGIDCAVRKCANVLRTEFSQKTVCTALELPEELQANEHAKEIVTASKQYLVSQYGDLHAAIWKPEFVELTAKALVSILESDSLAPIDSENSVLYAVLLWINHKPDRKKHLDVMLPYIRFPQLRKYYLLSVPLMLKDYPPETTQHISEQFNEAMIFKVGGLEWMKDKVRGLSELKRFMPRVQATNSNPFTMTEKFPMVSKWILDKPHWSATHFSNGYSLQFYVCKSQQSFGVYLHVYNQFIGVEDFCLPLSFTIHLLNKNGIFVQVRPCKTTFRRNSKGMPNLGVNEEDYVVKDTITVKIEVTFEGVD